MRQRAGLNIRCRLVPPVESSCWSSIWAEWQGDSLLPTLAILILALAYVFDNYLDKDIKGMESVYLSFLPPAGRLNLLLVFGELLTEQALLGAGLTFDTRS